jgi:iron-sulfur cluster assembly protein
MYSNKRAGAINSATRSTKSNYKIITKDCTKSTQEVIMITVTQAAADKIRAQIKSRGKGIGIKIATKMSGCSGLSYVLEFVDEHNQWLEENKSLGVSIFTDTKDILILDGLTVDYAKQGLNEGFEFINPNEKGRCGCGTSFTV